MFVEVADQFGYVAVDVVDEVGGVVVVFFGDLVFITIHVLQN
jgi:hypothetical protein